jgi:hypothetical protein
MRDADVPSSGGLEHHHAAIAAADVLDAQGAGRWNCASGRERKFTAIASVQLHSTRQRLKCLATRVASLGPPRRSTTP